MTRLIGYVVVALAAFLGGYLLSGAMRDREQAPAAATAPAAAPDSAAPAEDSAGAPGLPGDSALVVRPGPAPRLPRTLLHHASVNLDGDSTPERVELYADVDRDPQGKPMWDDGQSWALVVRQGNQVYTLFDEFVQLGTVGFTAVEHAVEDRGAIIIEVQAGSGVQVQAYHFDPARGGFVQGGWIAVTGIVVNRPAHTY